MFDCQYSSSQTDLNFLSFFLVSCWPSPSQMRWGGEGEWATNDNRERAKSAKRGGKQLIVTILGQEGILLLLLLPPRAPNEWIVGGWGHNDGSRMSHSMAPQSVPTSYFSTKNLVSTNFEYYSAHVWSMSIKGQTWLLALSSTEETALNEVSEEFMSAFPETQQAG